MKKSPFKLFCRIVNENCDVDVTIDHAGYQFKHSTEKKTTIQDFVVLFTRPASPSGYLWHLSPTAYATNRNSRKETEHNDAKDRKRKCCLFT